MATKSITTKDEFKKHVLEGDKMILVDFWAEWCAPCRMMAPNLEQISEKMKDDLSIVKVNVEASQDNATLAQEHGVQGIPNLQLFKDGVVIDQFVGMMPVQVLTDEIKKHLDK